jgi:hypothetical protein
LRYNPVMNTAEILTHIDAEIARLTQTKALLSARETHSTRIKPGRNAKTVKTGTTKKRVLSPEARARIAAAQKARWAKAKKAA